VADGGVSPPATHCPQLWARRAAAKACITRCFAPSSECSRSRVPGSITVRVRPQRRRRSVPWRHCFPNDHPGTAIPGNKWAALVSYGLTTRSSRMSCRSTNPSMAVTNSQSCAHGGRTAGERPGRGTWSFIDSCPASGPRYPCPWPDHGGIDGGYVKAGSVSKVEMD